MNNNFAGLTHDPQAAADQQHGMLPDHLFTHFGGLMPQSYGHFLQPNHITPIAAPSHAIHSKATFNDWKSKIEHWGLPTPLPTPSPLVLNIEKVRSDSPTRPRIACSLTNTDLHQVFTFMIYHSPLDRQSVSRGFWEVTRKGTAQYVSWQSTGTGAAQFNHRLVPTFIKDDAYVQLYPKSTVTWQVELADGDQHLPLPLGGSPGITFEVQLKGHWKGLWAQPRDSLTEEQMQKWGFDTDGCAGPFESNIIDVYVPQ